MANDKLVASSSDLSLNARLWRAPVMMTMMLLVVEAVELVLVWAVMAEVVVAVQLMLWSRDCGGAVVVADIEFHDVIK